MYSTPLECLNLSGRRMDETQTAKNDPHSSCISMSTYLKTTSEVSDMVNPESSEGLIPPVLASILIRLLSCVGLPGRSHTALAMAPEGSGFPLPPAMLFFQKPWNQSGPVNEKAGLPETEAQVNPCPMQASALSCFVCAWQRQHSKQVHINAYIYIYRLARFSHNFCRTRYYTIVSKGNILIIFMFETT